MSLLGWQARAVHQGDVNQLRLVGWHHDAIVSMLVQDQLVCLGGLLAVMLAWWLPCHLLQQSRRLGSNGPNPGPGTASADGG